MAESISNYPWTANTGNLQELLMKVQRDIYPPQKVTNEWLLSLGYKSTNDRPIVKILEFIGFVDASKVPTDLWKVEYRTSKYKQALAKGVMNGYRDLFQFYTNANSRSDEELADFFAPRVNGGTQVIQKTVATFKMLCSMSDFEGVTADKTLNGQQKLPEDKLPDIMMDGGIFVETKPTSSVGNAGAGDERKLQRSGNVIINITITLPETKDKDVYAAFFEALKAIM